MGLLEKHDKNKFNIFKDYSFYKKNGAYHLSYDSNVFHQKTSFNIKYISAVNIGAANLLNL